MFLNVFQTHKIERIEVHSTLRTKISKLFRGSERGVVGLTALSKALRLSITVKEVDTILSRLTLGWMSMPATVLLNNCFYPLLPVTPTIVSKHPVNLVPPTWHFC